MIQNNPFIILNPNERRAPSQEQFDQMDHAYEKLHAPLVFKVRQAVKKRRDADYPGASDSSVSLEFASYLESRFDDVISFAKNTFGNGGVNFSIEYQKENGKIASFYPDFLYKQNLINSI